MARPRIYEKFTSADNLYTYTFPRANHEISSSQSLRMSLTPAVGADYPLDLQGGLSLPKSEGIEVVNFVVYGDTPDVVDDAIDEARSKLYRFGLGHLWLLDSAGVRRWAKARLRDMPEITLAKENFLWAPVSCTFVRLSDWYSENALSIVQAITVSPFEFTIDYDGILETSQIVFRFRSNAVNGFSNPKLTNVTTGEYFQSTYDATTADSELKVDAGKFLVQESENNGADYINGYSRFSISPLQVGFLRLVPGSNLIRVQSDVTPNLSLEISYYDTY